MSKKQELQDKQVEGGFENIESGLTKAEQFFENNQKPITIGVVIALIVVAIGWLINTQVIAPARQEAQADMFNAQYYFEADSFALALNGDGMTPGFLDIIDDYGSTPAGNLAQYYAGVCFLNLGEFDQAKKYLSAFSSKDEILASMALGLIGDAEVEMGDENSAISSYKKAIAKKNSITAPIFLMKLGKLYATQGSSAEAKACFLQVKDDYPSSMQASQAEKYMLAVK